MSLNLVRVSLAPQINTSLPENAWIAPLLV